MHMHCHNITTNAANILQHACFEWWNAKYFSTVCNHVLIRRIFPSGNEWMWFSLSISVGVTDKHVFMMTVTQLCTFMSMSYFFQHWPILDSVVAFYWPGWLLMLHPVLLLSFHCFLSWPTLLYTFGFCPTTERKITHHSQGLTLMSFN